MNTCIQQLKNAGFGVIEREGGRVLIGKHGCAAILEPSSSGEPQFAVRPGLLVRAATVRERSSLPEAGERIAHLFDRGFQKFWQDDRRRLPALSDQLQALHHFEQDLRAAMGLTTLYNQALGTVSSRYIYDRLEGREEPKKHRPF